MGPRFLALLLAFCIVPGLIPSATAQEDVDVYNWGVKYFVATGELGSARMSLGPGYDGKTLIPFDGCGNILARPSKGAASVEAVGVVDGTNIVEIFFDEFRTPNYNISGIKDGVAANVTIDGSEDHEGRPTHPAVFGRVVAYAQARIEVDGYNFTDDGVNPKPFWGSLYVTNQGFRDNATNSVLTQSNTTYDPATSKDPVLGVNDWEMHLRLEAPGSKKTIPVNHRSQGDLPRPPVNAPVVGPLVTQASNQYADIISYQEEHFKEFRFLSQAPGGVATLNFNVRSFAAGQQPAQTSLRFTVIAPGGQEMANTTLAPTILSPVVGGAAATTKQVNIPLNQFGVYTIRVQGKVVMSGYSIQGFVKPPAVLDFNFWWEDVAFGKPAIREISTCKDDLLNKLSDPVISGIGRNPPIRLSLEVLAVGISTSALGILFLVKLVSDAVVTSQFKSVSKRRG